MDPLLLVIVTFGLIFVATASLAQGFSVTTESLRATLGAHPSAERDAARQQLHPATHPPDRLAAIIPFPPRQDGHRRPRDTSGTTGTVNRALGSAFALVIGEPTLGLEPRTSRLQGGTSSLTPVASRRQHFGDRPLQQRPAPPLAAISCHEPCHAQGSRLSCVEPKPVRRHAMPAPVGVRRVPQLGRHRP